MNGEVPIEVYALNPLQSWLLIAGLFYLGWRLVRWFSSGESEQ
jgi:hypothetical protein